MATTPPLPDDPLAAVPGFDHGSDPFRSAGPSHRFSHFNSQLFALGPAASPAQAKRALEAHLAETDRRMEEAGKLGTALVQQRSVLTERLKEVEKMQAEGELSDDLRQRLADIEKDYNEVARESARAFLPKSRVPSNEAAAGSPFVPEGKSGKRSVSPSKFEAQATGSPTKLNVPNRKLRNQNSNRIHDIEFATEISTSLIAQVRNLQGLLAEKEEELRDSRADNSKLEYELEGFQQRLKTLDDNEHRYKDENWNLETQVHDLMAKEKDAADREKKLTQALNLLQSEKNAGQRELDEIKLSHSKLVEDHAAAIKHHDIELGTAKRTMVMAESERAAMQKKIEDLTGQNTELAKAVSVSMRGRKIDRESIIGMSEDDFHTANDNTTPEQSPPPSPVKGTPRHSMLESETLKTSLAHAQRTIQSLRSNMHREKTEKIETRRLLQEARDELERLRSDPLAPNKRARKTDSKEFKKPPRLLGALRSARSEIFDDPNWEDQPELLPHPRSSPVSRETTMLFDPIPEQSDHFETANENSDAAFETANENATETDDFHTGAEEFSGDDTETETDTPSKRRTVLGRPPNLFSARSGSIDSSASTEDEDFPYEDARTPTSLPPMHHPRYPLRVSRGAFRRSRQDSEEPPLRSSPASFAASSNMGTPQQPAQSLAAELGDFDGSDNESNMSATPSKRSTRPRALTPPPALPPLPRAIMVDSGMMTEPLHELSASLNGIVSPNRPISTNTLASRFSTGSEYSDSGAQDFEDKLAAFPSPPTSSPQRDPILVPSLGLSTVHSQDLEPSPEPDTHGAEMAALRAAHAEQLVKLTADNSAAHAAAIDALISQHGEELTTTKHSHAQALDALRSQQAATTDETVSTIRAAHTREIESIKSRHADEISKTAADAQASHDNEIGSLKLLHAQQLAQKEAETSTAHAAELEALRNTHTEELSRRELANTGAHVAELETVKAAHREDLARRESEQKEAYGIEINALTTTHAEELSKKESELKAAASAELEALKTDHANELSKFKADTQALHAAELAALVETHSGQIDVAKKELAEVHAREFENLKAGHAEQIDQAKQSMGAAHSAELESLKISHLQQIDDIKASINAAHAAELESLRASHVQQTTEARNEFTAAQAAAIASLAESHSKQLDDAKNGLHATHSQELESIQATHARQIEDIGKEKETAHTAAIASLSKSHRKEVEDMKDGMTAAHAQELERLRSSLGQQLEELRKEKDGAHAAAIAALVATHAKQLDTQKAEGEATMSKEIVALKATHAQEIEALNSQHATAHAKELESFKAALAKQVESSKTEGNAAHNQQIEALNTAHAEIIDAHKRDAEIAQSQALEALKSAHERQIDILTSEHAAERTKEVELLTAKHLDELQDLRTGSAATKTEELESLANRHLEEVKAMKDEHEASKTRLREELGVTLSTELEGLRQEMESAHSNEFIALRQQFDATLSKELVSLGTKHAQELEALKSVHEATIAQKVRELADDHSQKMVALREHSEQANSQALATLGVTHAEVLDEIKRDHETNLAQKIQEITESHARDLEQIRQHSDSNQSRELAALSTQHHDDLDKAKAELERVRQQEVAELEAAHATTLASLRAEHQNVLQQSLSHLENEHLKALESAKSDRDTSHFEALGALRAEHSKQLDQLKGESDATLVRELDLLRAEHAQVLESQAGQSHAALTQELNALRTQHEESLELQIQESNAALARELEALRAQHAQILESQIQESTDERERARASHAAELEALRSSLAVVPPTLGYSSLTSVQTEPIESPDIKSPRREAFIIPQDKELRATDAPVIAEDDTRQSISSIVRSDTPDSQRPFKEITANTDSRLSRKRNMITSHQGSQTILTADGLDQLLNKSSHTTKATTDSSKEVSAPEEAVITTPSTVRIRRSSIDSLSSAPRAKHRSHDSGTVVSPESSARRPGSSASVRSFMQNRPPLPTNHREVIEAARSSSAHGGKGSMGPPLFPASAYRSSSSRPQTPNNKRPLSPSSVIRGTPTPRAGKTPGHADVHSSTRMPLRSRQSSMSSFASELDNRFNIQNGTNMDAGGFGSGTDPRMIQAITQTMIGEYLWKYTRKTGRGEMSEKRHRRYFWVHPYTRTLYWGDGDPAAVGRGEMKAKSVPIEAVRVVADDNPMPPGLHRKSLVVIAPGRTVKFTCTTGQRHETWFNALSYLLVRSGNEGNESKQEVDEAVANITQEDVDEFNPSLPRRPENGQRPRAPPSLSSYNSRPSLEVSMSIPTLTPTHEKELSRSSTFGRLSGYWRSGSIGRSTFSSLRSRSYQPHDNAIYEASEVHDSAEDLRQIIEQQDRESDRLENVRACCDGKHDVSTIPHTKRGRLPNFQSHTHAHLETRPSGSRSAVGSTRSRA